MALKDNKTNAWSTEIDGLVLNACTRDYSALILEVYNTCEIGKLFTRSPIVRDSPESSA